MFKISFLTDSKCGLVELNTINNHLGVIAKNYCIENNTLGFEPYYLEVSDNEIEVGFIFYPRIISGDINE